MVTTRFGLSLRLACRLVGLWRSTWQYQPHRADDSALRCRLRKLAKPRRRFGAPRLQVLLRREGWMVNHNTRPERLYRAEDLALRHRRKRTRAAEVRMTLPAPTRPPRALVEGLPPRPARGWAAVPGADDGRGRLTGVSGVGRQYVADRGMSRPGF